MHRAVYVRTNRDGGRPDPCMQGRRSCNQTAGVILVGSSIWVCLIPVLNSGAPALDDVLQFSLRMAVGLGLIMIRCTGMLVLGFLWSDSLSVIIPIGMALARFVCAQGWIVFPANGCIMLLAGSAILIKERNHGRGGLPWKHSTM